MVLELGSAPWEQKRGMVHLDLEGEEEVGKIWTPFSQLGLIVLVNWPLRECHS